MQLKWITGANKGSILEGLPKNNDASILKMTVEFEDGRILNVCGLFTTTGDKPELRISVADGMLKTKLKNLLSVFPRKFEAVV